MFTALLQLPIIVPNYQFHLFILFRRVFKVGLYRFWLEQWWVLKCSGWVYKIMWTGFCDLLMQLQLSKMPKWSQSYPGVSSRSFLLSTVGSRKYATAPLPPTLRQNWGEGVCSNIQFALRIHPSLCSSIHARLTITMIACCSFLDKQQLRWTCSTGNQRCLCSY